MQNKYELKQQQFISAMSKYENRAIFAWIGKIVSALNIFGQMLLLWLIIAQDIGLKNQCFVLISGFVLADFINGLVHLYMDNNDNYESIVGPLIAAFHLHHRTPLYKKNKIWLVYFNESGSKIWLALLMLLVIPAVVVLRVNPVISYLIFYFSVFSSLAEVSHYLCHVPNSGIFNLGSKFGFLLSKRHHGRHHLEDNVNYAFLNGMTDPLLNLIAKYFCAGYKSRTDMHYLGYQGKGTANR